MEWASAAPWLFRIAFGLCLAGLAVGVLIVFVTSIAAERFYSPRRTVKPSRTPSVTILKPVKGVDDGALENFRSFARQDYPDFEIVFGVADPADPVVPMIRALQSEFGPDRVKLATDGPEAFVNAKVNNLVRGLSVARGEILVINDSDCRVGPDYLNRVVATLEKPGVGLVTAVPVGREARTLPAALEVIGLNGMTLPGSMAPWLADRIDFAIGATLALRRETLEKIGGFAAIGNVIADDCALGEAVVNAGLKVTLAPVLVPIIHHTDTFAGFWRHMMRWGRTVRAVRPLSYVLMGIGLWPVPAFGIAALSGFAPWTWALVGGLAFFRVATLAYLNVRFIHDPSTWRYLPWILGCDLMGPAGWVACFFGSTVEWRGHTYRVRQGGRLERIVQQRSEVGPAAVKAEDAA